MKKVLHVAVNQLLLGICFAWGYFVSVVIFGLAGCSLGLWQYILAGFIGLYSFGAVQVIVLKIHEPDHIRMRKELLEALEQIAQGNFNVFVEKESGGYEDQIGELVDRVNTMAKELNSMENLRQDFISNVSHEFRSPLTSISGYAALLCKGAAPEQMGYAKIIEEECRRLSKLSDDLLLLSVLESEDMGMEKKEFRLDHQIENVVLLLEPQWTAKQMEVDVSLSKTIFCGNEDLLKQVWINLLVNAIKFTPEKGTIHAKLETEGGTIRCQVCDDGIGIPASDQMHIFERFYKVDKAHSRSLGGNGLGLSLVKKIVGLHGGNITVESRLNEGSTFTVTLPVKKTDGRT